MNTTERKTWDSSSCSASRAFKLKAILGYHFLFFRNTQGSSYSLCFIQRWKTTQRLSKNYRISEQWPFTMPLSSTLYSIPLRVSRHHVLDLVIMLTITVSMQERVPKVRIKLCEWIDAIGYYQAVLFVLSFHSLVDIVTCGKPK